MTDFFEGIGAGAFGQTPNPEYTPPDLKKVGPTSHVPDQKTLYQVQRNLLLAMQEDENGHEAMAKHHMRNAYKSLNRWLKEHT